MSRCKSYEHCTEPATCRLHGVCRREVPQVRKVSDEQVRAWADRHDLGISSMTALRDAFEDAQTVRPGDSAIGGVPPSPATPELFRCSAHPFHQPDCKHCAAQNTGEDAAGVTGMDGKTF